MNCRELREALADFIGGEADACTREAVQAHVEECEACRLETSGLVIAARAFEADLPSAETAERAGREVELVARAHAATRHAGFSESVLDADVRRETASVRRVSRRSLAWPVLRYAAAILAAFGGGYWFARTTATGHSTAPGGPIVKEPTGRIMEPIEMRFAKRFEEAARTYPGSSSLSWSLLSIARR